VGNPIVGDGEGSIFMTARLGLYRHKKGLWTFPRVVAASTMLPAFLVTALGVAEVGLASPAGPYPTPYDPQLTSGDIALICRDKAKGEDTFDIADEIRAIDDPRDRGQRAWSYDLVNAIDRIGYRDCGD
jgi:hypothetical protein